jgi:transcriptional regulator with XRE-family HTH domain
MNIGEKIKELREKNGKTQLDVSKALDVTYQTIYKYEKGIAVPPADAILKLAEYFNVTSDYLLGRTDTSNTVKEIDKKLKENNLHIAANSKVDLGKLAKLDDKQAKIINNLIDDFLEDDD